MTNPSTADLRTWWCTRGSGFPEGYMLWMPAFFLALDKGSNVASSMIWTLALLLTAALIGAVTAAQGMRKPKEEGSPE